MIQDERGHNCPNCGGTLPPVFEHTKLVGCAYCGSAVLLDDEGLRLAGTQSVMPEAPSLLRLGQAFVHEGWTFTPVGHARFDYDRGFWDEWWCLDVPAGGRGGHDGKGAWISVDEGDFALETPVPDPPALNPATLGLGKKVRISNETFTVTEANEAVCIAVRGSLPEVLTVGGRFAYRHLSGPGGRLMTAEIDQDGGVALHEGRWLDPFAIRPA